MEKSFLEAAKSVLGKKKERKRPWMSEESWALIEQRNELNTKMLGTHSTRIRVHLNEEYKEKYDKEVKRHIRADKGDFINSIAEPAEETAYHQNMRTLYTLTKN